MTKTEILEKIDKGLRGQGNQVDIGNVLADVLTGIVNPTPLHVFVQGETYDGWTKAQRQELRKHIQNGTIMDVIIETGMTSSSPVIFQRVIGYQNSENFIGIFLYNSSDEEIQVVDLRESEDPDDE